MGTTEGVEFLREGEEEDGDYVSSGRTTVRPPLFVVAMLFRPRLAWRAYWVGEVGPGRQVGRPAIRNRQDARTGQQRRTEAQDSKDRTEAQDR